MSHPLSSYAESIRNVGEAATLKKTRCRLCNKVVDAVVSMEDWNSDSKVFKFKCHGELDHQGAHVVPYIREMRMTQVEGLIRSWPVIAFDRYTMIPLPSSLGFAGENDEICVPATAGLDWLYAYEVDPRPA